MGTTGPDGPCGPPASTLCGSRGTGGLNTDESCSMGGLSGGLAKKPRLVGRKT